MNTSCRTLLWFLFWLLLGGPVPVLAQAGGMDPAEALFAEDEVLELTLSGDLKTIFSDRREEDRPYRPATITYHDPEGRPVSLSVGVKTRGYFRLHYLDCDVPPLRLDFEEAATDGTPFAGQEKLKLVTHCQDRSDGFEQRTLQEYLIYRIYNLLTDYSFRARLLRLTYRDTAGRRKTHTAYAFLIESEDHVAARHGGHILPGGYVHPEETDRTLATLLAVFQYMIGNTDWTVSTRHNIRILYWMAGRLPVALPYDFDWAGLIDAPYAEPDPQLGLKSVRDRFFMGYCRSEEELEAVFARFRALERDIYALFERSAPLERNYAEKAIRYLRTFFDEIDDRRAVRRNFLENCFERR